jgi:hypothetical protein
MFRDGPARRRATVVSGPDVWEIVRVLKAARSAEPGLTDRDLPHGAHVTAWAAERPTHVAAELAAT